MNIVIAAPAGPTRRGHILPPSLDAIAAKSALLRRLEGLMSASYSIGSLRARDARAAVV